MLLLYCVFLHPPSWESQRGSVSMCRESYMLLLLTPNPTFLKRGVLSHAACSSAPLDRDASHSTFKYSMHWSLSLLTKKRLHSHTLSLSLSFVSGGEARTHNPRNSSRGHKPLHYAACLLYLYACMAVVGILTSYSYELRVCDLIGIHCIFKNFTDVLLMYMYFNTYFVKFCL